MPVKAYLLRGGTLKQRKQKIYELATFNDTLMSTHYHDNNEIYIIFTKSYYDILNATFSYCKSWANKYNKIVTHNENYGIIEISKFYNI
jgi:hypothetical protein